MGGRITFQNVSFAYPTRAEFTVFGKFSLDIEPGTTVALIGQSGSGKSTAMQLLERFYDPCAEGGGSVLLDGVDIRTLDLQWLRSRVGLVGQEPVLFQASVRENIAVGLPGATHEQVRTAAHAANALSFIE